MSLILVSYPMKARLKIYARAEVISMGENPSLLDQLKPDNYKFRPERMVLFHIEAYDWNCPQHITQRYTLPEIEDFMVSREKYIKDLEQEVQELRTQLKNFDRP